MQLELFGSGVPFVGGVLDNLLGLVTLGGEGLVGLIVLAVLLDMYISLFLAIIGKGRKVPLSFLKLNLGENIYVRLNG